MHDACTMFKIYCKTLINCHHIPSTSMQAVSNTIYLIYVHQCDESITKAKFCAPTFLYRVEQKSPQIPSYLLPYYSGYG